MMKKILPIFIFTLVTIVANAQYNYTLDWIDYKTISSGWPLGATTYSMTETDGNPSSVTVNASYSGTTSILVVGTESPSYVSSPLVTSAFYQSLPCLITACELAEMTNGESVTVTFNFSTPVNDLAFTLFDVDANTPAEAGADRQERVIISALGSDGTTAISTSSITTSSYNTASGDTIIGTGQAPETDNTGDVAVSYIGKTVSSISLTFSAINIVGTPSANAEPGFGIYNMTFSTPVPLPISFQSFDVNKKEQITSLEWNVLDENNVLNYQVQASIDGREFKAIQTIENTKNTSYKYTDANIYTASKVYYRIAAILEDGSVKYTDVKFVTNRSTNDFAVFPNPVVDGRLDITYQNNDPAQLFIYDINGRIVVEKTILKNTTIDINTLPKGAVYNVVIVQNDQLAYSKMISVL